PIGAGLQMRSDAVAKGLDGHAVPGRGRQSGKGRRGGGRRCVSEASTGPPLALLDGPRRAPISRFQSSGGRLSPKPGAPGPLPRRGPPPPSATVLAKVARAGAIRPRKTDREPGRGESPDGGSGANGSRETASRRAFPRDAREPTGTEGR